MKIVEVERPVAVNPYTDDIAELARLSAENEKAAGEWSVAADEVSKTKFKIAKAANAIDKTAALVSETPGTGKQEGTVTLVYRLKARHKVTTRNRTPKTENPESAEQTEQWPDTAEEPTAE